VAKDGLVATSAGVGDLIPVRITKRPYPNGKQRPGLLEFRIAPHELQSRSPLRELGIATALLVIPTDSVMRVD
ncbi:MAG: hypothetical protein ABIR80_08485, partial [Opitutaceae bacterium]